MVPRERTTADECRLGRAALAGFAGGYIMLIGGYWMEDVFGLSNLDFAYVGLRYASGGKPGWWVIGIVFHFIDSILLGLLFAAVVVRRMNRLTKSYGPFWGSVAAGLAFGAVIWLVLAMLIAGPFTGSGPFYWRSGSASPALSSLAIHGVFGVVLGAIYGYREC